MSEHILNGVMNEYQARFGAVPGTQEPRTECQRWQQICQELVEQRNRLCMENASLKIQCGKLWAAMPPAPPEYDIGLEEIRSLAGQGPSLQELLAEVERDAED